MNSVSGVIAGTLIDTINGFKPIEEIKIGDLVKTHENRYQKVVNVFTEICNNYNVVRGGGTCKLNITDDTYINVLRNNTSTWIKVKELLKTDKFSYNISNENEISNLSNDILWLLGRYIADGWIDSSKSSVVVFAIGNSKTEKFDAHCPQEYFEKSWRRYRKGCAEISINNKEFYELCKTFGKGAINKKLPHWVINLSVKQLNVVLDGYFSGDGHIRDRNGHLQIMFTTVSRELCAGLHKSITKVYHKVPSVSVRHDKRKETFNDTYNCEFSVDNKYLHQITIENKIYNSFKMVERINEPIQVYNLQVEIDNSFTCDNVIVQGIEI